MATPLEAVVEAAGEAEEPVGEVMPIPSTRDRLAPAPRRGSYMTLQSYMRMAVLSLLETSSRRKDGRCVASTISMNAHVSALGSALFISSGGRFVRRIV